MRFSKANAKLSKLAAVESIKPFLANKRKVYSFDLLSGHNCPYSRDCKSMAIERPDGTRFVQDGPHTDFRCFSASQEAFYTPLYNLRKANGEILKLAATSFVLAGQTILDNLPKNAGVIRIHVGGDFKTQAYFDAWLYAARNRPDILFYAYTKSLPFWIKRIGAIPSNFVLTASKGGMKDSLIEQYNLRHAVVVESKAKAAELNLDIDHDDSHAADPSKRNNSFALLIHGLQPAGSKWGKAVKALKGEGSYARK